MEREPTRRLLGLRQDEMHPNLPPSIWAVGQPIVIVPLSTGDRVAEIIPGAVGWEWLDEAGVRGVYTIGPLSLATPLRTQWRARMFVRAKPVAEDPATGSAALAAMYALAPLLPPTERGAASIEIIQGPGSGATSLMTVGTSVLNGVEVGTLTGDVMVRGRQPGGR